MSIRKKIATNLLAILLLTDCIRQRRKLPIDREIRRSPLKPILYYRNQFQQSYCCCLQYSYINDIYLDTKVAEQRNYSWNLQEIWQALLKVL